MVLRAIEGLAPSLLSRLNQHSISMWVPWNTPSIRWSTNQGFGWKLPKPTLANWRRKGIYWLDIGELTGSNQSILKEINPKYSLERLILKLKLQNFGHLIRRADSLGKTLMLEKIEGRRTRGQERMRRLDGFTNSMDVSLSKLQETERETCHAAVNEVTKSWTWQRVNNNNNDLCQEWKIGLKFENQLMTCNIINRLRKTSYRLKNKNLIRKNLFWIEVSFPD